MCRVCREYEDLVGRGVPSSSSECKAEFIYFFDCLNMEYKGKIRLINRIERDVLQCVSNSFDPLGWVNNGNESYSIEGAWRYMDKKGLVVPYMKPTSEKSKLSAMYVFFDMLDVNISAKEIIIKKIKAALTQSKHNKKKDGLVSLSTKISSDGRDKLKRLASDTSLSMGGVLDRLINDEFERRGLKVR